MQCWGRANFKTDTPELKRDVTYFCCLEEFHQDNHTPSDNSRDEMFMDIFSPPEGTVTDINRSEWVLIF